MAARAASPTGTEVVPTDEGHAGHGAVLASALCCLEDESRAEINTWLAKVSNLLPSGKTLRFFPVARTQSVLASLVRDVVTRVRARGVTVKLVWLRNCETVRVLPPEACPARLTVDGVDGALWGAYRASAMSVLPGCCTHETTCGEDCQCVMHLFALLEEAIANAPSGCGTWLKGLPVGDLGLVQFEAVAAWMDMQTLSFLGETLESPDLRSWVEATRSSLVPHLVTVIVQGKDPVDRLKGACSCEVIRG